MIELIKGVITGIIAGLIGGGFGLISMKTKWIIIYTVFMMIAWIMGGGYGIIYKITCPIGGTIVGILISVIYTIISGEVTELLDRMLKGGFAGAVGGAFVAAAANVYYLKKGVYNPFGELVWPDWIKIAVVIGSIIGNIILFCH